MYPVFKRALDFSLSLSLLILLAGPCLLFIGFLLIRDGRPLFFLQERIGKNGHAFNLIKFRTLKSGTHSFTDPARHTTRTGPWMRRWGIDELPQLINILKGDMSFVGPRPTVAQQVRAYGPLENQRLEVPQGLTGWAQIHGRNTLTWQERIVLDIEYIERQSFALDVQILLRTPLSLWASDATYGPGGKNLDFSPQTWQAESSANP